MSYVIIVVIIMLMHEFGHLIISCLVGLKPKILSLGFWKPRLTFYFKEIKFQFTPWLVGGYISFSDNLDESKKKLKELRPTDQILICIAGCTVNILTGIIILTTIGLLSGVSLFNIPGAVIDTIKFLFNTEMPITGDFATYIMYVIDSFFIFILLIFSLFSIMIGLINLLPIPPLDGWQITQTVIETIRKKQFAHETNLKLTKYGMIFIWTFSILSLFRSLIMRL